MATEIKIKIQNELKVLKDNDYQNSKTIDPTSQNTHQVSKSPGGVASGVAKTIAINIGKQALQYATSNYGNLTGDYVMQNNISSGIELASLGLMALTGGVVGIFAAGTSLAIKGINYAIDNKKSENQARMLAERVGAR